MKAKDIKNKKSYINLKDGKHEITFDFNTLEELENIYGSMEIAMSSFVGSIKVKDVKKFMCAGMNACIENEEDHSTPFKVGKLLDENEFDNYIEMLTGLFNDSMPENEIKDEDEIEKN